MIVADIVREVGTKGQVESLALHGKVRALVEPPPGFESFELSTGSSWAVLDLYAITCLGENPFDYVESSLLTPRADVLFILKDPTFIGQAVTLFGASKSRGTTLRRQGKDPRTGFFAPVFRKRETGWVLFPNVIEPFKRTSNKEINDLFQEYAEVGFSYLGFVSRYLSFTGSPTYKEVQPPKGYTLPLFENRHHYTPLTYKPIPTPEVSFYQTEELTPTERVLLKEFLTHLDSYFTSRIGRLIPNTTTRVTPNFPTKGSHYAEWVFYILGVDVPSNIEGDVDSEILLKDPFYLYFYGSLSFELAEQLWYLSTCLRYKPSKSTRQLALIVEKARQDYDQRGTSLHRMNIHSESLLPLTKEASTRVKTCSCPLSPFTYALLKELGVGLVPYKHLVNDGYYLDSNYSDALSLGLNLGFLVEPLPGYFMLSDVYNEESLLIDSLNKLAQTSYDYDSEDLVVPQSLGEQALGRPFYQEELLGAMSLNHSFACLVTADNHVANAMGIFLSETVLRKGYQTKTIALTPSFTKPKWLSDSLPWSPLDVYASQVHDEPTVVLLYQAECLTLLSWTRLLRVLPKGSVVFAFGSLWGSSSVFSTLASRFPLTVLNQLVFDPTRSDLGLGVDFRETPLVSSASSLPSVVQEYLDQGLQQDSISVVSQGTGTFSKDSLSKFVESLLEPGRHLISEFAPVYSEEVGTTLPSTTKQVAHIGKIYEFWGDLATFHLTEGYYTSLPFKTQKQAYIVHSNASHLTPNRVVLLTEEMNLESFLDSIIGAERVVVLGSRTLLESLTPNNHRPKTLMSEVCHVF